MKEKQDCGKACEKAEETKRERFKKKEIYFFHFLFGSI